MANGPQDYRDPKVTTTGTTGTTARSGSNWLWYIISAVILLLLLGWLLGLFSAADNDAAVTDEPAATTEGATITEGTTTTTTDGATTTTTEGAATTEEPAQ